MSLDETEVTMSTPCSQCQTPHDAKSPCSKCDVVQPTEPSSATETLTVTELALRFAAANIDGKTTLAIQGGFSTSVGSAFSDGNDFWVRVNCHSSDEFGLCISEMQERGYWQSITNAEAEKQNLAYQRLIVAEAFGCWRASFRGTPTKLLVAKTLTMDQFGMVMTAYQNQFEAERKMLSWRLDNNHLGIVFLLMTKTRNAPDNALMAFWQFLTFWTWIGPPTLSITKEMPPADLVIRHIFTENFVNLKNTTDLSQWVPATSYYGLCSRPFAESIVKEYSTSNGAKGSALVIRLNEGRRGIVEGSPNAAENGLAFFHRQLVATYPETESKHNDPSPGFQHDILYAYDPSRPGKLTEQAPLNRSKYRRRGKPTATSCKDQEAARRKQAAINNASALASLLKLGYEAIEASASRTAGSS